MGRTNSKFYPFDAVGLLQKYECSQSTIFRPYLPSGLDCYHLTYNHEGTVIEIQVVSHVLTRRVLSFIPSVALNCQERELFFSSAKHNFTLRHLVLLYCI